jgi:hypothetical protein
MMRALRAVVPALLAFGTAPIDAAQTAPAASPASTAPRPSWILKSDENAQVVLKIIARFSPEGAGQIGVPGLDEQVLDLGPGLYERRETATREAVAELERRRAVEKDPLVRQDLDILVQSTKENLEGDVLSRKYELTYFDVPQTIFRGVRSLLDDQVPAERRPAALVRLRKYAGDVPGATPATVLAEQRMRERLGDRTLLGPPRAEVEKNLGNTAFYLDGIEKLFQKYQVAGYEQPLAKLKAQVDAYNDFVRREILPRSRTDFRLPPELYAFRLKQYGVEMPAEQLAARWRRWWRARRASPSPITGTSCARSRRTSSSARPSFPITSGGWPPWRRSCGASGWSPCPRGRRASDWPARRRARPSPRPTCGRRA